MHFCRVWKNLWPAAAPLWVKVPQSGWALGPGAQRKVAVYFAWSLAL